MSPLTQILFRCAALAAAGILGLQALWILAAEIKRPAVPSSSYSAETITAYRNAARLSAELGMVRGDLWADSAITYADLLWYEKSRRVDADTLKIVDIASDSAERALRLAPHNTQVWLLVAGLNLRFDGFNGNSAAALRMSYYTGLNEVDLLPLRVLFAAQSEKVLADSELETLVKRDIRIIISRIPEQKLSIRDAYRVAIPAGRRLIEQTLNELDPAFLASLRSEDPRP